MKKLWALLIAVTLVFTVNPPVAATASLPKGAVDPEICKLQENSRMRGPGKGLDGRYTGNATAFPFNPTTLPIKGQINVAMIFVDWADLPGTAKDYAFYQQQAKLFKDFYWMVSERKLNMNLTFSSKWFRIPSSYKSFTTTFEEEAQRGEAPKKQVFYDAAVAASDAETDYSKIDIVFYAVPTAKSVFTNGPHEFNFDYNGFLNTNEKKIYDTATAGDFFLKHKGQPPWVYYVHETGHMIGVPHQANEDLNRPGVEMYLVTPLGGYDIMSMQGGATRTITSWLRWLAGWLDDSQVICTTSETITDNYFNLTPINLVTGKPESLVIKLSETKAVVVESRRFDKRFDVSTGNSKNGLIVYTVDATKGSAQGNQTLLSPRNITRYIKEKNTYPDWRELDAMFFTGNSVKVGNLVIRAHKIGKNLDVVRVTKANR